MKKSLIIRIIILLIILLIVFGLIYFLLIPRYKFNQKYETPYGLTAEETIEKYFEYINNKNPAQANLLTIEPLLDAYSCNMITSASVNSIDDYGKPSYKKELQNYYDSKQYLVNYECHYLPLAEEKVFWGPSGSIFFTLVKETEDSDWKIADIYTGP